MKYSPETKEELQKLCDDLFVNLGDIDTSKITDMSGLFRDTRRTDFSGIETWDVSNVKDMSLLFCGSDFRGNLCNWNVSNVENMTFMFGRCRNFEGRFISEWDFSSLKYADHAFDSSGLNTDLSEVRTPNLISADFMLWGCTCQDTIDSLNHNHMAFGNNIFKDVFDKCMTEFKKIVPELIASKTYVTYPDLLQDFKKSNLHFEPHDGRLLVNFGKKCIGLLDQESEEDIGKFLNFIAREVSEKLEDLAIPGINPEFKFANVNYEEAVVDEDLELTADYTKDITIKSGRSLEPDIIFINEPEYKYSSTPSSIRIPTDRKFSYELNFDGRLTNFDDYFYDHLEEAKKELVALGINPSDKTVENFQKDCFDSFKECFDNYLYEDILTEDLPKALSKSGLSEKVAIGHYKGKEWYAMPLFKKIGDSIVDYENSNEYTLFRVDRLSQQEKKQIESILTDCKNLIYENCISNVVLKYEDELQDLKQFKKDHPDLELSNHQSEKEEVSRSR